MGRKQTKATKDKICKALIKYHKNNKKDLSKYKKNTKCKCGTKFSFDKRYPRKYCSPKCGTKFGGSSGGLKSSRSQARRSKNEIYFAQLCKKAFKKIECNKPIFFGWDADVIIHDLKLAVLWNGKWHYEKLRKEHSVKQVQNRDRIKCKEITRYGYRFYIIKDMGKYNRDFVKQEFDKLMRLEGVVSY